MTTSASRTLASMLKWIGHEGLDLVTKDIFQNSQTFSTDILEWLLEHQVQERYEGVGSNDTATDDGDFSFREHLVTTYEDTRSTFLFGQEVSTDLHGHPSSNLTHWQPRVAIVHRINAPFRRSDLLFELEP